MESFTQSVVETWNRGHLISQETGGVRKVFQRRWGWNILIIVKKYRDEKARGKASFPFYLEKDLQENSGKKEDGEVGGEIGTWIVNHVKNFELNYKGNLETLRDLKQKDMATWKFEWSGPDL